MKAILFNREALDAHARTLFSTNIDRMQQEADNPESDHDRWHMRIMVVLLTSALEGCDVDMLARATGYSRKFIEHVRERVECSGLELNPLNWISDSGPLAGTLSAELWGDAGVIEGRCELERYPDGQTGVIDLVVPSDFVPSDFVVLFNDAAVTKHGTQVRKRHAGQLWL